MEWSSEKKRPFLESKNGIKIIFFLLLVPRTIWILLSFALQFWTLMKQRDGFRHGGPHEYPAKYRLFIYTVDMILQMYILKQFLKFNRNSEMLKRSWWIFPMITFFSGLQIGAIIITNLFAVGEGRISREAYLPSLCASSIFGFYIIASTIPLIWCIKRAGEIQEKRTLEDYKGLLAQEM